MTVNVTGQYDINQVRNLASLLKQSVELPGQTNLGTVATGSTAEEYGNSWNHHTVITVSTTLGAVVGSLGLGKLLYTFPAGAIVIRRAYMSIGITQTGGLINADTPEGGLGTTVASGAVTALNGTAAFENIIIYRFVRVFLFHNRRLYSQKAI